MANDDRFNPASATREMFTEAITRALGDMTDAEIESLVQSAVGTEMSQRQMADLNLQSALESSVSAIRSELTLKASTSDVTAAVADEAAARQAADAELHDAVGAVAALGAKNNLLITNSNGTLIVNGITFTKNADQTITATGTATANADYPLNSALTLIIGQQYILSGCPSGGGADSFFLRQLSGAIDYGDGATFTAESSSANFFIRIRNGYTIQGSLTFKPMLRPAEITDDTFVPYAPTNRELYETKLDIESGRTRDISTTVKAGIYRYHGTGATTGLPSDITGTAPFGMLQVLANDTYITQLLYNFVSGTPAPAPDFYIRRSSDSGTNWTPWLKVSGTSVASEQSAASLMQAGRLDAELTDAQEVTDDA